MLANYNIYVWKLFIFQILSHITITFFIKKIKCHQEKDQNQNIFCLFIELSQTDNKKLRLLNSSEMG